MEQKVEKAGMQIADWLKNQDPYMEVHITSGQIEIIRIEAGIPVKKTADS